MFKEITEQPGGLTYFELAAWAFSGQQIVMSNRLRLSTLVYLGVFCGLAWSPQLEAGGITAVTRRTVMSGVPAGLGNAAPNVAAAAGTVVSPQPQAAAAVLLPGQIRLGAVTTPGTAGGTRPVVAAAPTPLRPGPGEALLARPVVIVGAPAKTPAAAKVPTPAHVAR